MKYKIGDKVRVRSDLAVNKSYGHLTLYNFMGEFRGKIAEVKGVSSNGDYCLKLKGKDFASFYFSEEMIEGLAETEFHVYDTVKHEKYGLGTIIEIGSTITVDFDEKPFDRPSLKNNVLYCSKKELIVVEPYLGGEDQ